MLPADHLYSSLVGYVTLGTSIAISLPQMFAHWRRKKADGISLLMLWFWLVGDILGLTGTVVQGLLHTQIILGVVNAIIDVLIISQCYYYRKFRIWRQLSSRGRAESRSASPSAIECAGEASEGQTVAVHDQSPPALVLPRTPTMQSPAAVIDSETLRRAKWRSVAYHVLFVAVIFGLSIMVWGVVVARVRQTATLDPGQDGTDPVFSKVGAAFGWVSCFIYTSSRYPQMYKNWKSKTCQGLSIWTFILLLLYNFSNIISIVVKSTAHSYLIVNLPWIFNSAANITLDFLILGQFFMYRSSQRKPQAVDKPTEDSDETGRTSSEKVAEA